MFCSLILKMRWHPATKLLRELQRSTVWGYFSFGTGNDYSTKVARPAKRLIVEVNKNMPRVHGDSTELHVSEVDAIVENHVPLLELPSRGPGPEDEAISRTIAGFVPDGACLQMGVGALPNLVCAARIVPRLEGPVTTPRIDTHYVVTEFGSANLKGLSSTERAYALIGLAHPQFRDELTAAAKKLNLI
jgi:acyl-CoA hydrolase